MKEDGRCGGIGLMINWIKRVNWVWVGILINSIAIWYFIFTMGFFKTLLYFGMGMLIGVMIILIKEEMKV